MWRVSFDCPSILNLYLVGWGIGVVLYLKSVLIFLSLYITIETKCNYSFKRGKVTRTQHIFLGKRIEKLNKISESYTRHPLYYIRLGCFFVKEIICLEIESLCTYFSKTCDGSAAFMAEKSPIAFRSIGAVSWVAHERSQKHCQSIGLKEDLGPIVTSNAEPGSYHTGPFAHVHRESAMFYRSWSVNTSNRLTSVAFVKNWIMIFQEIHTNCRVDTWILGLFRTIGNMIWGMCWIPGSCHIETEHLIPRWTFFMAIV